MYDYIHRTRGACWVSCIIPLRQGLSLNNVAMPCLPQTPTSFNWESLCSAGYPGTQICKPGWPGTQKPACLCLLSVGIKGVLHHCLAAWVCECVSVCVYLSVCHMCMLASADRRCWLDPLEL